MQPLPEKIPNSCRPLQIIPAFEEWVGATDELIRERVRGLVKTGLGGLVTNVRIQNYLRDETS